MRRPNLLFALLLSVLLLSGCNLPTARPILTPSAAPTLIPSLPPSPTAPTATQPPTQAAQAAAITPENTARVRQTAAFPLTNSYRLVFSADSQHLVVSADKQVLRISTLSGEVANTLQVPESGSFLAISPDGNLAAVTPDHAVINLVSLDTNQPAGSIKPQGNFSSAFFTPDGASLGVSSLDEIRVDLYDLASGSLKRQFSGFQTAAPVYNVFPTPDGKSLAWVSRARLQLMDIATGRFGPEFAHEDFIAGWALSPDGGTLVTSAGGEVDGQFFPLLFFWDARTGRQIAAVKLPDAPSASVAFSPDGQILAAAVGKTVQLYRTGDRTLLATLDGPGENISYLAFSPDGATLAGSAGDNLIHLWQVVP
jgi:WD40 repeat protein